MEEENKLTGVATLLKTPEGDIKLPRTAAILVQTTDGSNVETELQKRLLIKDYTEEIDNILRLFDEFEKTLSDFRFDIGTTANYTELALLNREASNLIEDFKVAIEKMEIFVNWESKWDGIKKELENSINMIKIYINTIENDISELNIRLNYLENNQPEMDSVSVTNMLATVDTFEMLIENNLTINNNKLDNISAIYEELYRQGLKGINEMPDIIKEKLINRLLL